MGTLSTSHHSLHNIIVHSSLNNSFKMSGILSKITDQISGQKQSTGTQQPSSGLLHKITDTVTGQKHPQDSQNQQGTYMPGNPNQFPSNTSGYNEGYGGNRGGYGGSKKDTAGIEVAMEG